MFIGLVLSAFLWMTFAGVLWDDRLILPGFFGVLLTLGLSVWMLPERGGWDDHLTDDERRPS
jgi:hypothetical protein